MLCDLVGRTMNIVNEVGLRLKVQGSGFGFLGVDDEIAC